MAYMNQELKKEIAVKLKTVISSDWKYTLSVRNHSTLVLTIRQAPVDLLCHINAVQVELGMPHPVHIIDGYCTVNHYSLDRQFKGDMLTLFKRIDEALNWGNHDNSDPQTDYFDVGWYTDILIGRWNDQFLHVLPRPAKAPNWKTGGKILKWAKKTPPAAYAQYLPENWAYMTPGRKAAATKKAMAQAALAQ